MRKVISHLEVYDGGHVLTLAVLAADPFAHRGHLHLRQLAPPCPPEN